MMNCTCSNNSCILRSKKSYASYYDQQEMKFFAEPSECPCCSGMSISEVHRLTYTTSINNEFNIRPFGHKCNTVKLAIEMSFRVREVVRINKRVLQLVNENESQIDEYITKNLKLKTLANKLISDNKKERLANLQLEMEMKGLRAENRRLKRTNKRLVLSVVDEPLDDDIDDDDQYDINIPDDTEDSGDHHGLLLEYERLKSYMISQNMSLGAICVRNGIIGVQKIDIFKAWVSKKIQD